MARAPSARHQRLESQMRRVLAELLREVKDPRVGNVTVTEVSLAGDLGVARVYVLPFGATGDLAVTAAPMLEGLAHAAGFLRGEVGPRAADAACAAPRFPARRDARPRRASHGAHRCRGEARRVTQAGGILLLDKPAGLSSNAALQRVRRLYARIKAGHTGSLDPLATGMLPICLGEATKIAGELLSERKGYVFTLRLGTRTSTGDAEGAAVETAAVPAMLLADVAARAALLLGPRMQVPPMYSALKRQGEPLYKLARRGVEVEREARSIQIYALEVLSVAVPDVQARVVCSKGTYVRTLGEELALLLGTCGHLVGLRREFVAPFELEPHVDPR